MNFPIIRMGNKTKDINHFKHFLPSPDSIKIMCEPFAGSFSLIRSIYKDVETLVCADTDFEFRKRLKAIMDDLDGYYEEKKRINLTIENGITPRAELMRECAKESNKYFIHDDFGGGRGASRKFTENVKYETLREIYNKITWYDEFKVVMEMYEDNEDAFVFLDPPYFSSYNKSYLGTEYKDMHGNLKDNTMMFIDILAYLQKSRCKIMCVLNKNAIIEHLYKDFIKGEYKKTYGVSRNKETLLIITNY